MISGLITHCKAVKWENPNYLHKLILNYRYERHLINDANWASPPKFLYSKALHKLTQNNTHKGVFHTCDGRHVYLVP